MRLTGVVLLGFGLLALTSCGRTQQVANNGPTAGQPESHELAGVHSTGDVHTEHGHADGHQQHGHETSSKHGSHGGTQGDHDATLHTAASGHDGHGELHVRSQSWHGTHGHGHGGHGQSDEHTGDDSKSIAVGDKVPDFEVTIDGEKFKLSELQKNPAFTDDGTLVLTFWCSFCHSCRHVENQLNELAKRYRGKAGVIALDASAGETTKGVAEFAKENDLTLPIALDKSGAAADIFGARVTTTTVVIDRDGVLRYCGQFGDDQHAFAADALKAVLAGEEVSVKKTRHKG